MCPPYFYEQRKRLAVLVICILLRLESFRRRHDSKFVRIFLLRHYRMSHSELVKVLPTSSKDREIAKPGKK